MTDLADLRAAALEILTDLGTTCTLQSISTAWATTGDVTETVTEYTATCSDLVDEAHRYGALQTNETVAGTFYLAASGLTATPALGDRVVYQSRNFAVLAVWGYRLEAGVAAWRLDVGEIGS